MSGPVPVSSYPRISAHVKNLGWKLSSVPAWEGRLSWTPTYWNQNGWWIQWDFMDRLELHFGNEIGRKRMEWDFRSLIKKEYDWPDHPLFTRTTPLRYPSKEALLQDAFTVLNSI